MSRTDVVRVSRQVLADNSRSFRWAASFLPADSRDDAALLYAVCRTVDDLADETSNPEDARRALDRIRGELRGAHPPRPLVEQFLALTERRGIDVGDMLELISGVESDLGPVRLTDDGELLRYCYRVAGTVGAMMSPLLGVSDKRALPHAIDLGVAMQLTNICRDVREDAERDRVYLPTERLAAVGVAPQDIIEGTANRQPVATVVCDLLDLADRYYRSADRGMAYIPTRSRVGIVVASRVYRAIGVHLKMRGGDALAGRTVVPSYAKMWWVVVALTACLTPTMWRVGEHDASLHRALGDLG
ncbi:MAG: phytoene/squalene synthase family protein [Persicimonas sp.]